MHTPPLTASSIQLKAAIKLADLSISKQQYWLESEQSKRRNISDICKHSLTAIKSPQTRLILALTRLYSNRTRSQFKQLTHHLVTMESTTAYPKLSRTKSSLPRWKDLTNYERAILAVDAIGNDPAIDSYHVTLKFTPTVLRQLHQQKNFKHWIAARVRRYIKTRCAQLKVAPPLIMSVLEQDSEGEEHMHIVMAYPKTNAHLKMQFKRALEASAGNDWAYKKGVYQSMFKQIKSPYDAQNVCNYLLKQSHDVYLDRRLTQAGKTRFEGIRSVLQEVKAE